MKKKNVCTECGSKNEQLFSSLVQDGKEKIEDDEEICIDCVIKRDRGEIISYLNEIEHTFDGIQV